MRAAGWLPASLKDLVVGLREEAKQVLQVAVQGGKKAGSKAGRSAGAGSAARGAAMALLVAAWHEVCSPAALASYAIPLVPFAWGAAEGGGGEWAQPCTKHPQPLRQNLPLAKTIGPACDGCGQPALSLKRCSGCSAVRYCRHWEGPHVRAFVGYTLP